MATILLYLEAFDVVSCEAVVAGVGQTDDGRALITLDQTCFYPRGGGQDWDTGEISGSNGRFVVEEVRLDEEGVVRHIGHFDDWALEAGQEVQCSVDRQRRDTNTRLHSAGHLIDMAMADLAPDWVPGRGAHYPHMSFVEYEVPEGETVSEDFVQRLQAGIEQLGRSDYLNKVLFISKDQMARYCRHVPDNIPTNKPSRIVLYADDFGIPCGGTHVQRVSDIGMLRITKVKIKKGIARVSYTIDGIN